MRVAQCSNIADFRAMARRRLPSPIFHYIDGAADDEVTCRRNTEAYESCDLVPSVLAGVETIDMSTTVMGQRLAMPLFCSPTALQRLLHHDGERAVAKAAEKFGTMFGVSSLGTVSLEELAKNFSFPQVYQFYFHKDRGLNKAMMQRAKEAGVPIMMLTVDSITGGNRERDLRTGFKIPEGLGVPSVQAALGSDRAVTIEETFGLMDPTLSWSNIEDLASECSLPILVKGVLTAEDATLAVEHGAAGIVVSNHGGRQLDCTLASADALPEVVDAAAGRVPVLVDGGVRRGADAAIALALGADAVLVGRPALWGLAVDGEAGVRAILQMLRDELEMAMSMCGRPTIASIDRSVIGTVSPLLSVLHPPQGLQMPHL